MTSTLQIYTASYTEDIDNQHFLTEEEHEEESKVETNNSIDYETINTSTLKENNGMPNQAYLHTLCVILPLYVSGIKGSDLDKSKFVNYNDSKLWPKIDDKFWCCFIEHGPEQGKNCDFRLSLSDGDQTFMAD